MIFVTVYQMENIRFSKHLSALTLIKRAKLDFYGIVYECYWLGSILIVIWISASCIVVLSSDKYKDKTHFSGYVNLAWTCTKRENDTIHLIFNASLKLYYIPIFILSISL